MGRGSVEVLGKRGLVKDFIHESSSSVSCFCVYCTVVICNASGAIWQNVFNLTCVRGMTFFNQDEREGEKDLGGFL